jgi:hypothetical protein
LFFFLAFFFFASFFFRRNTIGSRGSNQMEKRNRNELEKEGSGNKHEEDCRAVIGVAEMNRSETTEKEKPFERVLGREANTKLRWIYVGLCSRTATSSMPCMIPAIPGRDVCFLHNGVASAGGGGGGTSCEACVRDRAYLDSNDVFSFHGYVEKPTSAGSSAAANPSANPLSNAAELWRCERCRHFLIFAAMEGGNVRTYVHVKKRKEHLAEECALLQSGQISIA